MMSGGTPTGACIPAQCAICNSGKPCSVAVESSGYAEMRFVQVVARALNLPPGLMWGRATILASEVPATCPPITAVAPSEPLL